MKKILHITPDFNYSCGRSKLVYLYLKHFGNQENYEAYFIANGGDSLGRLDEIPKLNFQRLEFSTGNKNLYYIGKFYRNLKNYVVKNKIDLIHTHHRFPEIISVLIGKQLKTRTVVSTHGFVKGFKSVSYKSDKIISVSQSITSYLINKYKVKSKKIITLLNPAEQFPLRDSEFNNTLRTELAILPSQKVLLFIGRINEEKGCNTLLKSFSLLSKIRNDLVLIMSGKIEGSSSYIKSFINNISVKFVPPSKNNCDLYSIADIIILPSRKDSFPFVMIESGTFKKPFIGGNTGGIAEFIEDSKNGLLVEPDNVQQLTEKIIYLLDNPEIGKTLGNNLHAKVNRLCDFNNYFTQVENIYDSLIQSK
ncbi:MAG: glycosyltransferase family 4 protein [Ignavibacteriaceae bacterium]